jgi:hypothetical protein
VARKTKLVTITAEGRDKGKTFHITEMDADRGERWAIRSLLALSRGGIEVPPGMFDQGWVGLANMLPYLLVIGLNSLHGAKWDEVEPLIDEMMDCVKFQPPGTNGNPQLLQDLFKGTNCQIEEIATRLHLRREVLQLHMGFSMADALSTSGNPPSPSEPGQASAS